MIRFAVFIALLLQSIFTSNTYADDLRPAFLQITQIDQQTFDVLWKVPARGESQRLSLNVWFSEDVANHQSVSTGFIGSAHIQRWQISHDNDLQGATIGIENLARTSTDVLLRIEYLGGVTQMHRLTPSSTSYTINEPPNIFMVASTYWFLGIEHILFGVDHLLFVLALLFLVKNARKLVLTITAFTLSHSITLSLASLNVIQVPIPPVEAVIALSIVFVASEIIRGERGKIGLSQRYPWVVAFSFGLLHGLGFAAALGEIGLPQSDIVAALLFFNVGVEVGQLIFVAAVLAVIWIVKRLPLNFPQWAFQVPVYAIGSVSCFWVIERTIGFI